MSNQPILYSLASFHELILAAFDVAGARRVVEIGSEYGASTERLCAHAARVGGELVTIDPTLTPETAAFVESQRDNPHFRFVLGTSLDALPGLADADAFVIDGDHNYYTVLRELEAIARHRGDAPWLVFEHDVCWPCGRRDWYYAPDRIPAEFVHPYAESGGMILDGPELVPGGWGDGHVCRIARHEGGPRNGVRTAIEDFVAGRPDLCFKVIPVIFGLGIIYSRHAPWSAQLEALVGPLTDSPLLERIERNRLELALFRLGCAAGPSPRPSAEFPPGRNRLEMHRVADRRVFDDLWTSRLAWSIEAQSALCPAGVESFTLAGYCAACGGINDFTTDFMFGRPGAPAWRERQVCTCDLNCRMRSCFHVLTESLGLGADARVYCPGQGPSFIQRIRGTFPNTLGGGTDEDVTRLTFTDAAFDCIVSLDVLARVADYRAGLREMARCLTPGGTLLLTVPFCFSEDATVVRQAAGNPHGASGSNDFGWDLLDDLRAAGFGDATLMVFSAPAFGYVGLQYLFLATRCPATPAVRNRFAWTRAVPPREAAVPVATPAPVGVRDGLRDEAVALQQAGRWDDAETLLAELTKRHPDDLPLWRARVRGHDIRGRQVLAGLVREAALDLHPEWAERLAPGTGAENLDAG